MANYDPTTLGQRAVVSVFNHLVKFVNLWSIEPSEIESEMGRLGDLIDHEHNQAIHEAKRNGAGENTERLKRIERFLENNFLVSQYIHMEQQAMRLSQMLTKSPKDINIMLTLSRIENDINLLEPQMNKVNAAIWADYQEQWCRDGQTLKYFKTTPEKLSDMTVNKDNDGIGK